VLASAAAVFAFVSLGSCKRTALDAEPAACAKAGQTCKFAPGVLGVCTQSAGACAEEPCLVCMGQH